MSPPSSASCRRAHLGWSCSFRWTSRSAQSGAAWWPRRRFRRSRATRSSTSRSHQTTFSSPPLANLAGRMKLRELSAALSPTEVVGDDSVEIADLAYAAGGVRPGALFFCVPGARTDGHDFAAAAVERGAAALAVEHRLPIDVPQAVVDDTRAAMPAAAAAFFGHPTRELEVAGVTGTAGKTTTTYLLYSILEAAGRRPGLMGTVESRIGGERRPAVRTTPEAIDLQRAFRAMLDAGDRSVALEATSHGSELGRLLETRFAVLVFTNLSQDHLDFHETMEAYFDAKRRLFVDGLPPAAVNVGDPYGKQLADELRGLGGEL